MSNFNSTGKKEFSRLTWFLMGSGVSLLLLLVIWGAWFLEKTGRLSSLSNISLPFTHNESKIADQLIGHWQLETYSDEMAPFLFFTEGNIIAAKTKGKEQLDALAGYHVELDSQVNYLFAYDPNDPDGSEEILTAIQPTPNPTPVNVTPQASSPQTAPPANPSTNSLGWIRIGSVNNPNGVAPAGTPLMDTTQNVTIEPRRVPSIGDRVRISHDVNFRDNYPQAPLYRLASKKGTLVKNQYVVILNIRSFVDTTVSSSFTVVWAQVAFSE